jgi:two-component system, OmpR family, alkaline phosphatase synthesis response regulator PhoP
MKSPPEQVPRRHAVIIEDERPIRELLYLHLDAAGFQVDECVEGTGALRLLRQQAFDLIVLDVMLPGLDGVSVCRSVRSGGPNAETPILMVTARDAESDKVIGLESGADDYIAKPFGIQEFLARVTAVTRRHRRGQLLEGGESTAPSKGPVVIDPDRRTITVRGEPVTLTRQEFNLLHRLAARRGIVFSRAALLRTVWKDDVYVTDRTVDTVISRLRRKLEVDPRDPELILTAWGVGYKFADAE